MKVVTAAEMRAIEERAMADGDTVAGLMERAGRALAAETARLLGGARGNRVLVLAGPGNNGGDGLVAGLHLSEAGADVTVALAVPRKADDPLVAPLDDRGVPFLEPDAPGLAEALARADVVIDALLGTGRSRAIAGGFSRLLRAVAAERERRPALLVAAADIPSGADADTGEADPATLACTTTVTFGLPKPGHFRYPAADLTGRLVVADIGIAPRHSAGLATDVLVPAAIAGRLPDRPTASNKGTFGKVMVVGGCANYMGAPALAARGALRAGAGLLTIATPRNVSFAIAGSLPEATHLPLPESKDHGIAADAVSRLASAFETYSAVVLGCGLGQGAEAKPFVLDLLKARSVLEACPMVIDADALNLLAVTPSWPQLVTGRAVLTPHPGEMARLLESSIGEVQADRVGTAREAAARWQQVVVLKGAFTVIAEPGGRANIAPFANPALATAGTGDVLAGIIGALLAQDLEPYEAASVGVFLHGLAGEAWRMERGESGLLASDLPDYLPAIMRDLRAGKTEGWGNIVEERARTT